MALNRIEPGRIDRSLSTTVKREYRDLDVSFSPKSGSMFEDGVRRGDVFKTFDLRAIDQSIQTILLTEKGEKPFEPNFGSNLRRLLFELNTSVTSSDVEDTIKVAIGEYEPRVVVKDVELYDNGAAKQVPRGTDNIFLYNTGVGEERYSLTVKVICQIRNSGQLIETSIKMKRLR